MEERHMGHSSSLAQHTFTQPSAHQRPVSIISSKCLQYLTEAAVVAGQQLGVGRIAAAETARVLLNTEPLEPLQLDGAGQHLPVLPGQPTHLVTDK